MLLMLAAGCFVVAVAFAQQDPKKNPPPKDPNQPKVKIEDNKNNNSRPNNDNKDNKNKPKKPE
jgi:hypothetical protein